MKQSQNPPRLVPTQALRPGQPLRRTPTLSDDKKSSLFEGVSPGNVGNVFQVPPAEFCVFGPQGYGRPVRVLEITGDDRLGEMICVSLLQETPLSEALTVGSAATAGPCVGVVEFGAGAGLAKLEFDIPGPTVLPGDVIYYGSYASPSYQASLVPESAIVANGCLLTLPASSMRVYVRNDANAPYMIQTAVGAPPTYTPVPLNENTSPATIRVHSTYGRRPSQCILTRTIPVCASSGNYTDPFPVGAAIRFGIPAYARKVRFPRYAPTGAAPAPAPMSSLGVIIVSLGIPGSGNPPFRGEYNIPSGSDGELDLYPYDSIIEIINRGPETIEDFVVVFELAI